MKNKKMPIYVAAVILVILILVTFFIINRDPTRVSGVKKRDFTIESIGLESFRHMKKLEDGRSIYYLGLDKVLIDGEELLTSYINKHDIEEFRKFFNRVETYKDGGSKLYTCTDDSKCDKDISILFCNTLKGDKDIYIAHGDIGLTAEYCDNEEEPNREE